MFTRTKQALIALPLSLILAGTLAFPFLGARPAYADELSDAQATLDAANKELDSITKEYNDLQTKISDLDNQITDTTKKVESAQQAMLDGQQTLGEAVLAEYKSGDSLSLVNIVLSSTNVADFVTNLTYYSEIQKDQADKIEQQRKLNDQFSAALDELDKQRDEQQAVLDQASSKKADAEKVVNDASAKVSSIKEAQAQLEAMQKRAAEMEQQKQQQQQKEEQVSPHWNTKPDTPAGGGAVNNNSGGGSSNSNSSNSEPAPDTSKGWKSGLASAYGGSSDPSTPNPGTTATGATCDDSSMGVAIPMAWPNYRSYFGHAVEIRYGGKTVVATINDCGGLGGGARSLDLQPGVFKAFGFSTCQAWGVRTVSYRIL